MRGLAGGGGSRGGERKKRLGGWNAFDDCHAYGGKTARFFIPDFVEGVRVFEILRRDSGLGGARIGFFGSWAGVIVEGSIKCSSKVWV